MAMSYKTKSNSVYRTEFADYVRKEVANQGWNLEPTKAQHFYVDAVFYFGRTDMDTNNYWKVLLDAITDTQLVWLDDNVVCERVQRIYYDANNPRIELVIHPVDYIGIFDNAHQLDAFTQSNCFSCTRFRRNCSILKEARAGRVQPETDGVACHSYKPVKELKEIK